MCGLDPQSNLDNSPLHSQWGERSRLASHGDVQKDLQKNIRIVFVCARL